MISWYFFCHSPIYSREEHRLRCSHSYLLKPSLTFSTTCPILSRNLSNRFLPSTTNCFMKSYALFSVSRSLEFSAFNYSFSYITSISFSLKTSLPPEPQAISYTCSAISAFFSSFVAFFSKSTRVSLCVLI